MRYIVYGAGAIGATIGAKLQQDGADVTLIARGEHFERLRDDGLRFRSPGGEVDLRVDCADTAAAAKPAPGDVVLLTMKGQDTQRALAELVAIEGSERLLVVCAQNGVENERLALRLFPRTYGMFVYLAAEHLRPGEVSAFSEPCVGALDLGCAPHGSDEAAERIAGDLSNAGFSSRALAQIMPWKYAKLLSNLANAIGAILGPDADRGDLDERARQEAVQCFEAAGIDYVEKAELERRTSEISPQRAIGGHEHSGSSSVQSLQRRTGAIESDYLNGEIVLLGRLHGVQTPVNEALMRVARRMARERLQPGELGVEAIAEQLARDRDR
jgi:2-dehydropantoate 2-reductase